MRWIYRIPLIIIGLFVLVLSILTLSSYFKGNVLHNQLNDTEISDYQTIEINDLTMAYREYGDSSNTTLVFIHGFLGSSYDWRYLSEALMSEYHIIAIDLIGFGASDKPDDFEYTRERHAEMIYGFITEKDIDPFVLAGHSMGGAITLYYANLYPQTLQGMILFSSAGLEGGAPRTLPLGFYTLIFKNYYLQRLGYNSVHYQETYQSASYFDPMYYFTQQIPAKTLQAFSQSQDTMQIESFIEAIEVPTLIIFGKEDTWIPYNVGETLNELLTNSTLVLLDDTGHIPFIESLEASKQAVLDYLNELE